MAQISSEILIVGAGPAGIAAAVEAAAGNRQTVVVDDNPDAGGQIWRAERLNRSDGKAIHWLDRLDNCGVTFVPGTQIVAQLGQHRLLAESQSERREITFNKLILATGARERFLPFPGWTLPGVVGAGGLQALVKSGMPIEGKRIVIAGTGPLALPVAAYLLHRGAHIPLIAEQTSWRKLVRFAGNLVWSHREKLRQAWTLRRALHGVPYRTGIWPVRCDGEDRIRSVTFSTGRKSWTVDCDYLATGFDLVPNLEVPILLGCAVWDGFVEVDGLQNTTVPNIWCSGEPTGIGGVEKAILEGRIAALAATGRESDAENLFNERDRALRFADLLKKTFSLGPELRALPTDETLICRCEDVEWARIKRYSGWRDAKLQTRCGMGPCQGRICGPALAFLKGWSTESTRPPIYPTALETFASW